MRTFLFFFLILLISGCTSADREKGIIPSVELPERITFSEHVAPIIFENCTPCHREGSVGPFNLKEYEDLVSRSKTIKAVVADNIMPPWPADTNYSRFSGEKILSYREKSIILGWIDSGMERGIDSLIPPLPYFPEGSLAGTPDATIEFPEIIDIPGNNEDVFRIVKVPFELEKDTFVKMVEFVPGNKQLVHHVNGHLVNYRKGAKTNVFEGKNIFDAEKINSLYAYKEMKIANDDGSYPVLMVSAFNYLPGVEPNLYPQGIGGFYISDKGAFLLNTLHYGPSSKDTTDASRINIFYTDKKPERPLHQIHMGSLGDSKIEPEFVIKANEINHFSTRYTTSEDISVLSINPHLHLLGKDFKAYAITPSNDTIPLIHIPQWDFRWQYFYTFRNILKIPKGSEIVAEASFDNTINNPLNPFHPPKTITEPGSSMKTTDEMFQFFLVYIPYQPGDEEIRLGQKHN